jgi:hypothetical protein
MSTRYGALIDDRNGAREKFGSNSRTVSWRLSPEMAESRALRLSDACS